MVLTKVKYKKCKEKWTEIFSKNRILSPYMSVNFTDNYLNYFRIGLKRWDKQIVICQGTTSKGNDIIVPLLFTFNKKEAFICGDLCATGYLDFLYPENITTDEFDEIFDALSQLFPNTSLFLNKINQSSILNTYLSSKHESIGQTECVYINVPNTIDDYYQSLSKSVKQNYRTAKNRLCREGKVFKMDYFSNCVISNSLKHEIMEIYDKRETERNNTKKNVLKSIIRNLANPISNMTFYGKNNFVAVLRIEDKIAGFLAGVVTDDGKVLVLPRLSIDSSYGVYCPGTLLIFETIRYLIDNTNVKYFDLSRGNEKYKFSMGGNIHMNYSYKIIL